MEQYISFYFWTPVCLTPCAWQKLRKYIFFHGKAKTDVVEACIFSELCLLIRTNNVYG